VPGTVLEFDEYFVLGDVPDGNAAAAGGGWDQHEARAWGEVAKAHGLDWRFLSHWTQRFSVVLL
jgi:hypothetical protein